MQELKKVIGHIILSVFGCEGKAYKTVFAVDKSRSFLISTVRLRYADKLCLALYCGTVGLFPIFAV